MLTVPQSSCPPLPHPPSLAHLCQSGCIFVFRLRKRTGNCAEKKHNNNNKTYQRAAGEKHTHRQHTNTPRTYTHTLAHTQRHSHTYRHLQTLTVNANYKLSFGGRDGRVSSAGSLRFDCSRAGYSSPPPSSLPLPLSCSSCSGRLQAMLVLGQKQNQKKAKTQKKQLAKYVKYF